VTTVVAAGKELYILTKNLLPTEDRVYGVAAVEGLIVIRTGSLLVGISGNKDKKVKDKKVEDTMQTSDEVRSGKENYAALPKAITSFGATVLGDNIYVYGGHYGKAHHYYEQGQSGELLCLDTKKPEQWKVVATGPRLQGLAIVAHGGVLYRIGGFAARNQEDEEQDLWSVADFVRFRPQTEKWEALSPLPIPCSSFDACIIGDMLYVVGGWSMQGDKETVWHDTPYSIDLAEDSAQWRELPKPQFQRRALSVGTYGSKLYVIGGMQADGKVTRRTAVFDPAVGVWSEGPELPGEDMEGFGTACCTLGGRLHVSTSSGKLLRLAKDGRAWEELRTLGSGRFFHRMLPISDVRLISLGGANMETGKFSESEVVDLH
jgi:N-acetylneuraminic acid mutarotase